MTLNPRCFDEANWWALMAVQWMLDPCEIDGVLSLFAGLASIVLFFIAMAWLARDVVCGISTPEGKNND